jgi:hypothetical protein
MQMVAACRRGPSDIFDVGDGFGVDVNIGASYDAVRPDGAANWQIKFGISILFP